MHKILANATKRHKTSAYEMHDLDPILVVKHGLAPRATTHHFAIEFDRNSSGRQIKLGD